MPKQHVRTAFIAMALTMSPFGVWAQESEDASEVALEVPAPLPVRTMLVPEIETSFERQFFGRVSARDTVSLAFEVGGQIEMLDAMEGTRIPAGTMIAALDLGPFERRIERAELTLEQAQRQMRRALSLAEKNVASQVRAEDAQTAYDLARVELRDARAALEDAQIIAPFDAQIADRMASQHAITEPGQPIVRLHDLSEMRVQFDLPERLLHHLGDVASVAFFGVVPGQTTEIPLEFREFRAETGEVGQSYVMSLAIQVDAAAALLPGQTLLVRAGIRLPGSSPLLPPTAIGTAADGTQYVVLIEEHADGLRAKHVSVEIASPSGSGILVTGLEPGSEIVEVGAHAVDDGAQIKRYVGLSRTGS